MFFLPHIIFTMYFASLHFVFLTNRNMVVEFLQDGRYSWLPYPECFNFTMLTSKAHSVRFTLSNMEHGFKLYAKKKLILTAYLSANQWIVVVILPK
jgi:hypothetical protein